jgi:hypothetical protein
MKHDWNFGRDLFEAELQEGHTWAQRVHERFLYHGLASRLTPYSICDDLDDRWMYAQEQDIHVWDYPIEVKSRRLEFTQDPRSYPYGSAFVDTVFGWDRKETKPLAVVLVSRVTSDMLVVSHKSQQSWGKESSYDRVRNMGEEWYTCPKGLLLPFETLTDWLRARVRARNRGS